jgi:response regulator receiver domain-containing protein
MRLLLVEDDEKLARAVARGLRHEGYAVDVSGDGDAALLQAAVWLYDAIVLDVMLPQRDGRLRPLPSPRRVPVAGHGRERHRAVDRPGHRPSPRRARHSPAGPGGREPVRADTPAGALRGSGRC